MIFDFTFAFPIPFRNPFTTSAPSRPPAPLSRDYNDRPRPILRPDVSFQSPVLAPTLKRRRGWEPPEPLTNPPTLNTTTVTHGLLSAGTEDVHTADYASFEAEELDRLTEWPSAKRRRTTLTDTLLTSALNVALISTAFGITAYRLWKGNSPGDVGDESPPPYEQGNWDNASGAKSTHPPSTLSSRDPTSASATSSTCRKRGRQTKAHAAPRRRPAFIAPSRSTSHYSGSNCSPSIPPEETDTTVDDVDEQMDWMSSQLQHLIAQGQKALGNEIVVGTDAISPEDDDLVDDGHQDWHDEMPPTPSFSNPGPTSSSPRKPRRASPIKGVRTGVRCANHSSGELRTSTSHRHSHSYSLPSSYEPGSRIGFRPSTPLSAALDGRYSSLSTTGHAVLARESSPDLLGAMQRVRQAYGLIP